MLNCYIKLLNDLIITVVRTYGQYIDIMLY